VNAAPAAWMRIVFAPPGFFLNDPLLTIHVNGWQAYAGSFARGLDVRFPVVPGPLAVRTRIEVLGIGRDKTYAAMAVHGHALEMVLEYSRLWGNFTSVPQQRQVPLGG
jgi:hypothetical protein